jgi:hypothetical protein
LRPGADSDTVRLSDRHAQPDAVSDPKTVALWIGQPLRDRDCQRDALPVAVRHGDPLPVAERQPEGLELAVAGASRR